MTLHDASYKHWDGHHLGIWHRRLVIAQGGLKGCLQGRWMRHLITVCWAAGLAQVAILFLIGQLLVADSVVVQWMSGAGRDIQALARTLISWLEKHPEISVRATQNLLFYFLSSWLLTFSLVAIALSLPHLITRDLSSNAIIIYSSKAISRFDYLLGKFATVMGLLTLTWLGPVCASWLLGNLLAPNWGFFWHSRGAFTNTLFFALSGMVVLSILAMGVSASSPKEKVSVSFWVGLWLLGNAIVGIAHVSKPWLKFFSFRFDLEQLGLGVFRLSNDLKVVQDNIPFLNHALDGLKRGPNNVLWQTPEVAGALTALTIMLVLAAVLLRRKVKAE